MRPVAEESVDVFELNHFYDECGRLVFDQAIFWRWDGERFQVVAWRLVKGSGQIPVRDARGSYTAVWFDGERLRRVRAGSFRETWLQFDPELAERTILPAESRKELAK